MKLKKIASLMLAGIMAVSMLAGCNGNTINDDPAQSEEPSAPAGYSALVQEGLSNTATKKVSLNDSTELNNALKAAMEYASNSNIAYWYDNVKFPVTVQVVDNPEQTFAREMVSGVKSLIADMNAENDEWTTVTGALKNLNPTAANMNKKDLNATFLFIVDGGKGANGVMNEVASLLNDGVEMLDKHFEDAATTKRADYEYVGSVSAYTKTLTGDHDKSLTFVAVNIAREIV